jgi:hypothetical protein
MGAYIRSFVRTDGRTQEERLEREEEARLHRATMSREAFLRSIFVLADVWTNTVSAERCVDVGVWLRMCACVVSVCGLERGLGESWRQTDVMAAAVAVVVAMLVLLVPSYSQWTHTVVNDLF